MLASQDRTRGATTKAKSNNESEKKQRKQGERHLPMSSEIIFPLSSAVARGGSLDCSDLLFSPFLEDGSEQTA